MTAVRLDDDSVRETMASVEACLERLEALPADQAEAAIEGVESVVRVYAEALGRAVELAEAAAPGIGERLTEDPLLRELFSLHGIGTDPEPEPDAPEAFIPLESIRRRTHEAAATTAASPERCDLCSEAIPDEHRHLVEAATGEIACACRACALLFDGTATGRYRVVGERRAPVDADLDSPEWRRLGVPVGLAFFVPGAPGDDVRAVFPSPAGPTEAEVEPADWAAVVARHPELASLEPGVEAVLVHRLRDARECWILPVDDCYRLVGLFRQRWSGFTGGDDVWRELGAFFDDLRAVACIGGG
ncbi:MAG TPA: DUF5947 family protein [Acidimicrobiia bacterium]|nr:DUF5947 family protein [Acidimicrobiia bacterium]